MEKTIFDAIERPIPPTKEGYFEVAKKAPRGNEDTYFKDISDFVDSFWEGAKEYGKTALKGGIEGITRLGRTFGPLQEEFGKSNQQQLAEQTAALDELLPTDEGYAQASLRRGLQQAPTALAFPGTNLATLPRAIAAGFLGEGAKELGAPEWAQTAAELTAYIGPDITQKLLESGSNAEIIRAAKAMGLTDEAITPLIQSDFKQRWLARLIPRRGSTQRTLANTKQELDAAYETFARGTSEALSEQGGVRLFDSFNERLRDLPASLRDTISRDLLDLISEPITSESLMNFWRDLNHEMRAAQAGGASANRLSLLKQPIREALQEISPALNREFNLINDLYGRYYRIAERVQPNLVSDLVGAGENLAILGSIGTGNFPVLPKLIGEKGAREISRQMLLNPRFQQLSRKMFNALNENGYTVATKVAKQFANEIREIDPEVAEKLEVISKDDFEKALINHQKEKATRKETSQ